MDSAVQRINTSKTNWVIQWIVIYPVDSAIQRLKNWRLESRGFVKTVFNLFPWVSILIGKEILVWSFHVCHKKLRRGWSACCVVHAKGHKVVSRFCVAADYDRLEKYLLRTFSRRKAKHCFRQRGKCLIGLSKKKATHIFYTDLATES